MCIRDRPWAAAGAGHGGADADADADADAADEFELSYGGEEDSMQRPDTARPGTGSRPQTAYSPRVQAAGNARAARAHGDGSGDDDGDDSDEITASSGRVQRARLSDSISDRAALSSAGGSFFRVEQPAEPDPFNDDDDNAMEAAHAAALSAAARDSERGTAGESDARDGDGGGGCTSSDRARRVHSSARKSSSPSGGDYAYRRALDADVLIGSRLQSPTGIEPAVPAARRGGAGQPGTHAWGSAAPARASVGQRQVFSPLIVPPSTVSERHAEAAAASARGAHAGTHGVAQVASLGHAADEEDVVDLLYDPTLNCYYEPRTGKYYELSL